LPRRQMAVVATARQQADENEADEKEAAHGG
jgi:hypothetical protein